MGSPVVQILNQANNPSINITNAFKSLIKKMSEVAMPRNKGRK